MVFCHLTVILQIRKIMHNNYICAYIAGLLDMSRLDALKEGDGERNMCHWGYDFASFSTNRHPK